MKINTTVVKKARVDIVDLSHEELAILWSRLSVIRGKTEENLWQSINDVICDVIQLEGGDAAYATQWVDDKLEALNCE